MYDLQACSTGRTKSLAECCWVPCLSSKWDWKLSSIWLSRTENCSVRLWDSLCLTSLPCGCLKYVVCPSLLPSASEGGWTEPSSNFYFKGRVSGAIKIKTAFVWCPHAYSTRLTTAHDLRHCLSFAGWMLLTVMLSGYPAMAGAGREEEGKEKRLFHIIYALHVSIFYTFLTAIHSKK